MGREYDESRRLVVGHFESTVAFEVFPRGREKGIEVGRKII